MFETLHKIKTREKAGARTAGRFEFQANFSILRIIDLHEAGGDYRAIFDHFDDLTILDSASKPTHIEFFQIKARSAATAWTIKQLAKEEMDTSPPRSIIGKMYQNAAGFAAITKKINFVSNRSFRLRLKDGTTTNEDHTKIDGINLDKSEIAAIDAILEPDFPSPRNPDCAGVLVFERTNLTIQDQAVFVTGRLATYLKTFAADESFAVNALYEVLYKNVTSRTASTEESEKLDEFHKRKSITRDEIALLIQRVQGKKQFENDWHLISKELADANLSTIDIIKIHTAAIAHLRERARGQKDAVALSEEIRKVAKQNIDDISSHKTIYAAACQLKPKLQLSSEIEPNLTGALLLETYEALSAKAE